MEDKPNLAVSNDGEFILGGVAEVVAANLHSPAGGSIEAAEEVHEGGFSATAGTDDGNKLTLFDSEAHTIEGANLLIADTVDFTDILEKDEAHSLLDFSGPDSAGSTVKTVSPSAMPDRISTSAESPRPTTTSRRSGLPSPAT